MNNVMRLGRIGFFRAAVVVLAVLGSTVAPSAVADGKDRGGTTNFVELIVTRGDDFAHPGDEFLIDINVVIPGVPGATGVTVVSTGGLSVELDTGDNDNWWWNVGFVDLETMKTALDGAWTVTISGASPSISTFNFDAGALVDSDFFATPTDVFPPDGSTTVPPDVVFSWSDPTVAETADALVVHLGNKMCDQDQDDDSIFGSLDISDTSWDPPLDLNPGFTEFGVWYANIDLDAFGLVDPLMVTSGSVAWGNSPFAPDGYPASTPLLVLGSQTTVEFQVGSVCPADLNNDGTVGILDLLALLAAWGTDPCGPPDFDADGIVGILDLLTLLTNWGPCV